MSYEVRGKITKVFDLQTFDSGFQKKEMVLTTEEQYPQELKMEFIKDKVNLLDQFNIGDSVTIHFNLRGSQWNDRYFVNLQGWKIEAAAGAGAPAPQAPQQASGSTPPPPAAPAPSEVDLGNAEEDDLPF